MIKLAPGFPGVFQAAHKGQEEILLHKGSQTHSNVFKTSQAFHFDPKIKERGIPILMYYSQPVDESPT